MAAYKGIQGYSVQSLSSDPTADDTVGQLWYNSDSGKFKYSTEGAGAWAAGGTMNEIRFNAQAAGATSTTALCFGGKNPAPSPSSTKDFNESYNGTAWTELADLNTVKESGYGFGTQTSAVCLSGFPSPPVTCETWNGTSWTETNSNNTAKGTGGKNGTSSTAGLISGGQSTIFLNETETWDGTSWTETANLNTARAQNANASYAPSTDTLTFGGETPPYTAVTESWNGTSWTEEADLNSTRADGGGAGVSSNDAIYFGGYSPTYMALTEKWNGTSWTEVADLATAKTATSGSGTTSSAMYAGGDQPSGSPRYTAESQVWADPSYTIKTVTTS